MSFHLITLSVTLIFRINLLFLAVLGLGCCTGAFSSCSTWGFLFSAETASHCGGVSCCSAQSLGLEGFRRCGAWAELPCSMWRFPRPGIGRWINHQTTREVL